MIDLNAPERFAAIDPLKMLEHIAGFPAQCGEGWRIAQGLSLPDDYSQVRQVVVCAMGGSAIGGDLMRTLLQPECKVPIIVHRDYGLPAFADDNTLVIVGSHSGNTEESLSGFDQGLRVGAKMLAITSGGELAARAQDVGIPLLRYNYVGQPRAALGYSFMGMLAAMQKLGFSTDKAFEVKEAITGMQRLQTAIRETVPTSRNAAKQIAHRLHHRIPMIYAAEHLSAVARRWQLQFNENSKCTAIAEVFPELDHNAVAGYPYPAALGQYLHVILLTSTLYSSRMPARLEVTGDLLRHHDIPYEVVEAQGKSLLAQILWTTHVADYVSYYLAMLYDADPWEIEDIRLLKEHLARA